ncbi:MAG: enoyl-CoA hydratase [Rhodospirillaceae bacterium]|jgi:enoyl-CoA hydratase/carnithine racemase|nr:enoyl-CoA hydratase [Rhodospirillaceae bacterium]
MNADRDLVDSGTEGLVARREGAVGWIVLNNPSRHNALSLAMYLAIERVVAAFEADPAVRVVVVTGAGERAFASGADISEFEEKRATAAQIAEYDGLSERAAAALERAAKPTIAMIRGYCIGGGLDLALRTDLRIASRNARFAVPAVRLGLGYAFDDIKRLVDIVGPASAKEILYTGRQFDADEALAMGLVHRVVQPAELAERVGALADSLAANAPLTVLAMKRCIAAAVADPGKRDLAAVEGLVTACFESADYAEGRRAFMEKRQPVFRGR